MRTRESIGILDDGGVREGGEGSGCLSDEGAESLLLELSGEGRTGCFLPIFVNAMRERACFGGVEAEFPVTDFSHLPLPSEEFGVGD